MKKIARLLPVALLLTSLPCAAQGPLSPPGAPAPTMKTLEQIEPRTPISSLPYPITEPGSYYVVSNLHSTGHGLVIQTNGVTVDLMGFSLTGSGNTTYYGIYVEGTSTNNLIDKFLIKGGSICGFGNGLRAKFMNNSRFEHLFVSGSTSHGFLLTGNTGLCKLNTVVACSVSGSTGVGFYLDGRGGACNKNRLVDCTTSGNTSSGIYLHGEGSGSTCDGNTIANCTISGNDSIGVYLDGDDSGQCNGNTIADCSISGNDSTAVYLDGRDSGQCNGNTIVNCSISANTGSGVFLDGYSGQCNGNTIRENTISKNTNKGIYLYFVDGNRVEANNVWGTGGATSYGIRTAASTDNFILKNTCVGQTNNFLLDSDDTYGPIVTNSGALPTSGAAAHPWANFSR